ncbi:MAG: bifunctional 3-deoxy-7-phosphoheptulonate synthase/chorismate mutase type II [Flavobacteriales bacterium]|nr:bifunctional 3-deoxy-7-phosphoheptulonate synthase/chorismate mutase type II [Flavobacteriales bacterium]
MELNITPMREWLPDVKKPLIIAGPCSAEHEDQVVNTAKEIHALGKVSVLRAGIWKPRTRPNCFEGIGEIGLEWLATAKKETGMLTTTEVATPEHVELCLKHGVDILWIGARTTVNPFSVQAIADALKGVDIPVLVKNPINPDYQLWLGAMERINLAGITKLGAIHRGFSSAEKSPFRNIPGWSMAIELKRNFPNIPIINDPSHIAGNRDLISYVSQKALDLDLDGLMIETHIQPSVALSDAAQQVTPERLGEILNELKVRETSSDNQEFTDQLAILRKDIDELDEEIVQKLSTRMKIAKKIGEFKRDNEVTILQMSRWEEIVEKRVSLGKAMGLDEKFTKELYQRIHSESIKMQEELMK